MIITEANLPPPLLSLFLLLGRVAIMRELQYQGGGDERYRIASEGLIRAAETLPAVTPGTRARLADAAGRRGADALTALATDMTLAAGIEGPLISNGEAFAARLADAAEFKRPPDMVH